MACGGSSWPRRGARPTSWRRCSARSAWTPRAVPYVQSDSTRSPRCSATERPCSCSTTASTFSRRSRRPSRNCSAAAVSSASSRRAARDFGIPAEVLFDVEPLAPSAAVELFEARVGDVRRRRRESATTIVAICERLDRLPLALELAAARTRHLRLDEILERLTEPLRRCCAKGHERRRRISATSRRSPSGATSCSTNRSESCSSASSVFADGATLEAARAVCAARGVAAADVERLLDRLIDKSLIVADRPGAETQVPHAADARRLRQRATRCDAVIATATLGAHAMWVRGSPQRCGSAARRRGRRWPPCRTRTSPSGTRSAGRSTPSRSSRWQICDRAGAVLVRHDAGLGAAGSCCRPRSTPLATRTTRPAPSALAWAVVFATMVQDVETADRSRRRSVDVRAELGDPARLGGSASRLLSPPAIAATTTPPDGSTRRDSTSPSPDSPIGLGHVSFAEGAGRLVEGDSTPRPSACSTRSPSSVARRTTSG